MANMDEGRKHAQCCTTCREVTCREVTQNNDTQRRCHLDDVACCFHHMLAETAGIWGLRCGVATSSSPLACTVVEGSRTTIARGGWWLVMVVTEQGWSQ